MNSRIRRPLYVSFKSWLCCCSLPSVAPQQLTQCTYFYNICVHLLKVCWIFVKRTYFKSLLKVYYRSVFAESFKTFIFQKFWRPLCHKVNLLSCVARRPLCHKVNLPRSEARRRRFIMTCNIFGTGQTNILGLCYLFGKTCISFQSTF